MAKKLNTIRYLEKSPHSQHGAVLLVMLVILIMGGTALLLNSLNSVTPKLARDRVTADALALAKEALIGRAVLDETRPGSLPCPDTNDDGSAELLSGNNCPSYIGRLPWKTLGITDLRDGSGERLWYSLSKNFRDDDSNSINSDTLGTLSITGNTSASNLIAIVFSPGANTTNQSRSSVQTLSCTTTGSTVKENYCATNYLEGINANSSPPATPNTLYTTDNTINDQIIYISTENLLPIVEKRIAREAKSCLDDYAAISANKYPWAAPTSSTTYTSTSNTLFGRFPDQPTTITNSNIINMINAISALKAAVNNCILDNNTANRSALNNAGNILENAAEIVNNTQPTSPAIPSSVTDPAKNAGDKAQDSWRCENINNNPTGNIVQLNLDAANAALSSITFDMSLTWPTSCTLLSSSYWTDWKSLVFYQVSDGYKPMASSPSCGTSCLSIIGTGNNNSGSGTYRSVVLLAGKKLPSQTRSDPFLHPPNDYLSNNLVEGSTVSGLIPNAHVSNGSTTAFKTYNWSDPDYKNINDLILCLDGKNNCK